MSVLLPMLGEAIAYVSLQPGGWRLALPGLAHLLHTGIPEGRETARQQLISMAMTADLDAASLSLLQRIHLERLPATAALSEEIAALLHSAGPLVPGSTRPASDSHPAFR